METTVLEQQFIKRKQKEKISKVLCRDLNKILLFLLEVWLPVHWAKILFRYVF